MIYDILHINVDVLYMFIIKCKWQFHDFFLDVLWVDVKIYMQTGLNNFTEEIWYLGIIFSSE